MPTAAQRALTLTAKGQHTRTRILDGAERAFARSGSYADTRIADIAAESQVAYGSLYTYFDSKDALFHDLALRVGDALYRAGMSEDEGAATRLAAVNAGFLRAYRERASMLAVIEQATSLSPELHLLRRQLRQRLVSRVRAAIAELQARGTTDPELDAHTAAHALVSMTDSVAYLCFVLGEPLDEEVLGETLTRLWMRSLGVEQHAADVEEQEQR